MLAQSSAQQKDGGISSSTKREFFAVEAAASRHGRSIEVGGRPILVKVSGNDTGGEFAVLEVPADPNVGPPLHIHHVENEWFYVLKGEVDVQVGTEVVPQGRRKRLAPPSDPAHLATRGWKGSEVLKYG